jgi:integration host factor subunit alpha
VIRRSKKEKIEIKDLMFCKASPRGGCMTMTKANLVGIISEKINFGLKESTEIVEQVFDILKETLEGGEMIKISGFGNFVVRQKRPRRGRNPQTGEKLVISERRVVTFKPSHVLRRAVNNTEGSGVQSAIQEG